MGKQLPLRDGTMLVRAVVRHYVQHLIVSYYPVHYSLFSSTLGKPSVAVSILSSPKRFHRSAFEKFWRAQAGEVLREIPSPIVKGHRHQVGLCEREPGPYYRH